MNGAATSRTVTMQLAAYDNSRSETYRIFSDKLTEQSATMSSSGDLPVADWASRGLRKTMNVKRFNLYGYPQGFDPLSTKQTLFDVPTKWRKRLPDCFRLIQWLNPVSGGRRTGVYEYIFDSYPLQCRRVFLWASGATYMLSIKRLPGLAKPGWNDDVIQKHGKPMGVTSSQYRQNATPSDSGYGSSVHPADDLPTTKPLLGRWEKFDRKQGCEHDKDKPASLSRLSESHKCQYNPVTETVSTTQYAKGRETVAVGKSSMNGRPKHDVVNQVSSPTPRNNDVEIQVSPSHAVVSQVSFSTSCNHDVDVQVSPTLGNHDVASQVSSPTLCTHDVEVQVSPTLSNHDVASQVSSPTLCTHDVEVQVSPTLGNHDMASQVSSLTLCIHDVGVQVSPTVDNHDLVSQVSSASLRNQDVEIQVSPSLRNHSVNNQMSSSLCTHDMASQVSPTRYLDGNRVHNLQDSRHTHVTTNVATQVSVEVADLNMVMQLKEKLEECYSMMNALQEKFAAVLNIQRPKVVDAFTQTMPAVCNITNSSPGISSLDLVPNDETLEQPQTRGDVARERSPPTSVGVTETINDFGNSSPTGISTDLRNNMYTSEPPQINCEVEGERSAPDGIAVTETTVVRSKHWWSEEEDGRTLIPGIQVTEISSYSLTIMHNENGPLKVGEGAFGVVHLADLRKNGVIHKVVVKSFDKATSVKSIISEAKIMNHLDDTEFFPRFYGLMRTSQFPGLALVQEYFGDGMTLYDVLQEDRTDISKATWVDVTLQLARGLRTIHSKGVLLNDIKDNNILVDSRADIFVAKFIDVGLSTYKQGHTYHFQEKDHHRCRHLAPEINRGQATTPCSDVFSLGVVFQNIKTLGGVRELTDIVSFCMSSNPDERPTVETIISAVSSVLEQLSSGDPVSSSSTDPETGSNAHGRVHTPDEFNPSRGELSTEVARVNKPDSRNYFHSGNEVDLTTDDAGYDPFTDDLEDVPFHFE